MRPPGAMSFVSGAASRCSGPSRMLAKTRSNGARARTRCRGDAVRFRDFDQCAGTVEPGIGAGDAHRFGIDVGCQHALPQRPGRRNGEHAAAGAEIENAQSIPPPEGAKTGAQLAHPLAQAVERQKTAARRAVVAGAEGERRLDLDADPVGRTCGAVVGAVNEESPSLDGLEACEALFHPILRGHALETQPLRRRGTGGCRHQRSHRVLCQACRQNGSSPASRPRPLSTRLTADFGASNGH